MSDVTKEELIRRLRLDIEESERELCSRCDWCRGDCDGIYHDRLDTMKNELKKLLYKT